MALEPGRATVAAGQGGLDPDNPFCLTVTNRTRGAPGSDGGWVAFAGEGEKTDRRPGRRRVMWGRGKKKKKMGKKGGRVRAAF